MPKLKTHKGLAKRIKVTASGKLKYRRPGGSHLMSSKSGKRCRHIGRPAVLTGIMAKRMKIKLCV